MDCIQRGFADGGRSRKRGQTDLVTAVAGLPEW